MQDVFEQLRQLFYERAYVDPRMLVALVLHVHNTAAVADFKAQLGSKAYNKLLKKVRHARQEAPWSGRTPAEVMLHTSC